MNGNGSVVCKQAHEQLEANHLESTTYETASPHAAADRWHRVGGGGRGLVVAIHT